MSSETIDTTQGAGREAWRDYPPMSDTAGRVEPAPRRVRGYLAGRAVFDTTDAGTCGSPAGTRSTTSRSPTSTRRCSSTRTTRSGCASARPGGTACVPATWSGRAPSGCTATTPSRVSPAPPGSSGTRWTPGTRRTSRSSSTPATPTPGSTRCAPPGSPGRARRRRARRVVGAGAGVRDRAADPLLPRPHRGRLVPAGAQRHPDRLPVQGPHHRVLGRPGRGHRRGGRGLGLRLPDRALLPIAGLVAFLNEHVDISVDGRLLERPVTPFS